MDPSPSEKERLLQILQSTSSSAKQKAEILREYVCSGELLDVLLAILDSPEEVNRKEIACTALDVEALRDLTREWMLDGTESESKRVAAINYLGGPSLSYDVLDDGRTTISTSQKSEIQTWETLTKDQNSCVASAATENMLEKSSRYWMLFPWFMKHLPSMDEEAQAVHLDSLYSDWNMCFLPSADATDLWDQIPADSYKIVAELLRHFGMSPGPTGRQPRVSGTAYMILRTAPSLPMETFDVLLNLWNDTRREDILEIREELIYIFGEKSSLPQAACDILFNVMRSDLLSEDHSIEHADNAALAQECMRFCADHVARRSVGPAYIAQMLNDSQDDHSGFWSRGFLLELIGQDADISLVPLLNSKALTALFTEWRSLPQEQETDCREERDGLYVYRGASKFKVGLQSEDKIEWILKNFNEIKSSVPACPRKIPKPTVTIIAEHGIV